ncbi:DapH/DapD/GlmU-related protein [Obesumbacterium proteus]|uniref:DapH/DapD/GlmU-related protein n=1 Tax=Obesumbacterium proteus TaxID=82983 RepID=UPI00242D6E09|nr:DapH/DapD/GlmU-related protein [Obesumbacterium proteus]
MPYFKIIKFLFSNNTVSLIAFWKVELINNQNFSWYQVYRYYKKAKDNNDLNTTFWFWWRLANFMFTSPAAKGRKAARRIQRKLMADYNIEVMLGASIGFNPFIQHFTGIVISDKAKIGNNMVIRQCVTIGVKTTVNNTSGRILIGDNVQIGANTCIIGDNLTIGDNVIIGSMVFVNKNIQSDTVYIEKKTYQ